MRKISELLYRFAQWLERHFVQDESADEFLKRNGYELRGDEIYYKGQKVGTKYKEQP